MSGPLLSISRLPCQQEAESAGTQTSPGLGAPLPPPGFSGREAGVGACMPRFSGAWEWGQQWSGG